MFVFTAVTDGKTFFLSRCYDACAPDNLPPVAQTFIQILRSDAMFLLLSAMTGLQLHDSPAPEAEGVANGSDASKCWEPLQFGYGK